MISSKHGPFERWPRLRVLIFTPASCVASASRGDWASGGHLSCHLDFSVLGLNRCHTWMTPIQIDRPAPPRGSGAHALFLVGPPNDDAGRIMGAQRALYAHGARPSRWSSATHDALWALRLRVGMIARLILVSSRSPNPIQAGGVLRQKASFRTGSSTCHRAWSPSLKKMVSPAP